MFDSWQSAFASLKKRIEEVFSNVEGIKDELVKQRRANEDQLNNLELDNMPQVKRMVVKNGKGLASVTETVTDHSASIESLVKWQNEADGKYASSSLTQTVSDHGVQIADLQKWQNEADGKYASSSLTRTVSDQGVQIADLQTWQNEADGKYASSSLTQTVSDQGVQIADLQTWQNEADGKYASSSLTQTVSDQGVQIADLQKWQNEADGKYASSSLTETVSDQGVQIADLQTWQNEADGKYASSSLTETVSDQGVQIADLQTWQNEADGKYASIDIEKTVSDQGASISVAVSRSEAAESAAGDAMEAATNGASIVAAVNGNNESSVKIKADKIELTGVTAFVRPEQLDGSSDVEQTVIDGGNIRTNTISADSIKTGGSGAVGTVMGNNIMFNANAVKYGDVNSRYIFFVDPALYNVFIGVDGGEAAQVLRLHSQSNIVLETYNGSLYHNSAEDKNQLVTKGEVQWMIEAALENITLDPPEITIRGSQYTITNPNSVGRIVYRTYWTDSVNGKDWQSEEYSTAESSITDFFTEYPDNDGYVGVFARIEYGNAASEEVSDRVGSA